MKNKNNQQTPGNDNPVFENKNKAYGAYQLRQSYEKRLTAGLLSTVGLFVLALLGLVQIGSTSNPPTGEKEPGGGCLPPDIVKLMEEIEIIPDEGGNKGDGGTIEIVKTEVRTDVDSFQKSIETGSKTALGRFGGSGSRGKGPGILGSGEGVAVVKKPTLFKKKEKVFEQFYDKAATFPGGPQAYEQYVNAHIRRPEVGFTPSGKINLMLSVDEEGNVVHVELVKGIGFGYDEAVMEVIKGMPKWNPGIIAGKPAAVKFGTTILIQQ